MESLLPFIIALVVCLALILWVFALKKKNTLMHIELKAQNFELIKTKEQFNELEEQLNVLSEIKPPTSEPDLNTMLHNKRNKGHTHSHIPEKYQYILSLIEKGLDTKEIAAILFISTCEAEQLSSLAKISARP